MGSMLLIAIQGMFTPSNLLMVIFGTVTGIIFGALPGFSAVMGVAVLIPLTFGMDPAAGLIMLGGVYCGAIYGGSITAVLLKTPGTDANAMTAIDGFEMTKKGRAGEALRESAIASWWGGIFSAVCLLFFAPALSRVGLRFGPPENLMLAVFGMSIIGLVCADDLIKGLIAGVFGLLLGTVGVDPISGTLRYTFGQVGLYNGVALVPALIGLFSIAQLMVMSAEKEKSIVLVDTSKIRGGFRLQEMIGYPVVYLRSSIIGTLIGIIPGAGTSIAAFLGYNEGKRFSKHPEEFGKGSREAVASTEAANNAVTGGSLIPTLTLGIPGNAVTAVLLGGLMMLGLTPGYPLFTDKADVTYPFILSLFFANTIFLVVGVTMAPKFAQISKTPTYILIPMIACFCTMGAYALNVNMMDVFIMFIFGIIGYIMNKFGFTPAPIILGMILGPIADKALNQTVVLSHGENLFIFMFQRPICLGLLVITVITLLFPILRTVYEKRKLNNCRITD